MTILILFWVVFLMVLAPFLSATIMQLKGSWGKAALVAIPLFGLMQIFGMISQHLGPLGDNLSLMMTLAAWFQLVRVVYGTDRASTFVFLFWHLFFLLLAISLTALFFSQNLFWVFGL